MQAHAKRQLIRFLDEDGNVKEYVLNGRKCFITNACYADFMCVVASIDRSLGYKGTDHVLSRCTSAGHQHWQA